MKKNVSLASVGFLLLLLGMAMPLAYAQRLGPGKPEIEAVFYEGETLFMNAIVVVEFSKTSMMAHEELFGVIYVTKTPTGTHSPGHPPEFPFAHDHIIDEIPGDKEFRALWHVHVVWVFDPSIPLSSITSESALLAAVAAGQAGGLGPGGIPTPGAPPFDSGFAFLCAIVPEVSG